MDHVYSNSASMTDIRLTPAERIILANEYRILSKVDPENADHYTRNEEILKEGYAEHYGHLEELFSDELPPEQTELVRDIITMYDEIWVGFQGLSDQEKEEIGEKNIQFPGFHGNSESALLHYAKFRMATLWSGVFFNLWDRTRNPRHTRSDFRAI
jgi:uncharacterized protein YfbU (UPF0304 family)